MNLKQLLTKLNPFKKPETLVESPISLNIDEPKADEPKEETPIVKRKSGPSHISELDKQYMVTCLATGMSATEVARLVEHERGIIVSQQNVWAYGQAEKWQPLMRKIRQEVMSDLASISGSHKKVRLERAEKVYDKAIDRGKLDIALKATEHQRKEMEEQSGSINLTLNQFNVLSDDELQLKQKEVLDKIQRLSQKKGITLVEPANKTEAART